MSHRGRHLRAGLGMVLAGVCVAPAAADNWPHWRGPKRTGASAEVGLPLSWSATENVRWKLALPEVSGSTPIVWNQRIFLQVAEGQNLSLWCVERDRGTVLWRRPLDDRNQPTRKGNLSSPSPVTDGTTVWVVTGTGVIAAFDFEGRERWRRDLQRDYGKFGILHGYASSPLLAAGRLLVQLLHGFHTDDPSYVLALDQETGATRWRVERPTDAPREAPDAYTTPALLERDGRAELVVSGADYVTGHDLDSGRELWRVGGLNPTRNPMQRVVASPLVVGRAIFAPSRVSPLLALEAPAGAGEPPALAWSFDQGPDVPTPAWQDGRLYLLRDNGVLFCLDAVTGQPIWGPERIQSASYSASPVIADGRLYATSETGRTTVVRAGPEFELLATNELAETTLSSLAIADGRIYLRTAAHLYCIGRE